MKINEVLAESTLEEGPILNKIGTAVGNAVGTAAKGVGAVAGGIAGLGAAAKKGFQAGKQTVAAAGDEPANTAEPQPAPAPTPATGTAATPTPDSTSAPAPSPGPTPATQPQAGKKPLSGPLGSLAKGAVGMAAALGNKQAQNARAFVNTRPDGSIEPAKQPTTATEPAKEPTPTPEPAPAPASKTMAKDQILQWIGRNSEDYATLKSFADGIGMQASPAPAATQQPAAKAHTGGKVAGQLSQTPNAIRKREQRAAASSANKAGAGAFGQMANQLGQKAPADYSQLGKGAFPGYGTATYGKPTYSGLPKNKTVAKEPAAVAETKK